MSTEGSAKAPPEQGEAVPPAPNLTAATAVAAAEPSGGTFSENKTSNNASSGASAKPKNGTAYDKKWLENLNLLKPCIGEDGTIDYSTIDEDAQKRMQNFVKDQRKCYRKRENNEATPMSDERFRLLSEANFDFKPSETSKAKREKDKKEKKKAQVLAQEHATKKKEKALEMAKEVSKMKASPESPKSNHGEGAPTPTNAKTEECAEEADSLKKPAAAKAKKSTPMKTEESDKKISASKSPKLSSKTSTPTATSARKRSGKPTYLDMAHDAIASLKDRTGSSVPAISKWIMANNEHAKSSHPNMFKNRLSTAIKSGVKDGRFMKIRNSYKINAEWTKKQKAALKAKDAAKKKAEKQRQKDADKAKQQKKVEMEKEKKKAAEEKKRKENVMTQEEKEEAARKKKRKEEAEARRKHIEQQLRKRRYPIEDTRLHRENKEWGVKPREHVVKRPALPQTLTCLIPPHLRANTPKKAWGAVANASASGNGALMGGDNERGLVTDAIHVYHFFCGDVGIDYVDYPVPKFSLKTLFFALDEVLNGNAKTAKSLPPLLTHLFVTALRMLTAPQQVDGDDDEPTADLGPVELRLQDDLSKLSVGLNAVSWSQCCFFYIDLMDRYYTSDISLEEEVSPGEGKLDMSYFWNEDPMEEDKHESEAKQESGEGMLPNGYNAYIGDPQGVLAKGYSKLQSQAEPWLLKADELMALLRTLTDDILAKRPDLAEDIAGRGAKLNELSKAKRAAIVKYNKVRLAYEGPKKPTRPKKSDCNDNKTEDKKDDQADADTKEESEEPFVPTATKQQFFAAEKAYNKAVDAYENGLNKLISRTEPMCFDRNFNAIYFFRHDPTMLHVEQIKHSSLPPEIKSLGPELTPFSNWHCIDTKPLFEQFLASLDDRGQRENETMQICSNLITLKRRLQDDKKENTRAVAREREKEEIERRLENAKNACDAEDGRRSGRLAGMAQGELEKVKADIELMDKAHEDEERQEKLGREKASDYSLLTGLQMVADLFAGQRSTRSSKKSDDDHQNEAVLLANIPSHKLWMDKSTGGNGTMQILVEALFALETKCNNLSPWTRQDISREAWRKQLSDASCAWAVDCVMQLGPSANANSPVEDANEDPYAITPSKKQKVEPISGTSFANIVTTIKLCLKDLELRIFEVSGRKKAIEEADTAAEDKDASSDDEDDQELNKRRNCWKIKINALRRLSSGRYGLIRDIIVAAITVARKSHLNQVAADLKAALQLLRPHAGGEARTAAIQVLDKYGGYDGSDDEDEDVDFDELAAANAGDTNVDDEGDGAEIASLLCDEVRMISGSIGGDDFADKSDWSDAIKDCKSVARLAMMIQSFLSKADGVLRQMKEERDNLDKILGLNAKRTSRTKTSIKKHDSSTAIWCNAKLTDKLVKARVQGFPWWPAHVCEPLDSVVADALEGSGYALISSVGNPGMFMVAEEDVIDFTDETDEDLSQYDKSILEEMQEVRKMLIS
ncbi:hypothetical protein ACHAXR_010562 [Thalassiosira sp. AJA248-18]